MKLLLGLGNAEKKYQHTRHNIGFQLLDDFASEQAASFQPKPKFSADIAEYTTGSEKVILAKPTTFYNDTGIAARALMDFYKLTLDDILIIHDDAVLDFGKIRIRRGGQAAGNNGLKSLHQHIGDDFWHIRIGTDSLLRKQIGDIDFVIGKFNTDEQTIIRDWVTPTTTTIIEQFLQGEIEATSYKLQ